MINFLILMAYCIFTPFINFQLPILREISYFRNLDHPKITKIFQVYEAFNQFVIIFDCDYSNTMEQHLTKRPLWEDELKEFIMKMLYLLKYIHSNRLSLISIRPEDIAYDSFSRDFTLISITHIARFDTDPKIKLLPPGYIAPEILNSAKVCSESDIFSLGALLFKW